MMLHPPLTVRLTESAAMSLSSRVRAVEEAMWTRHRHELSDEASRWWPVEIFDADLIARKGDKYFRVPYTMDDAGKVEFGQPAEVEQEYVPVERVSESVLSRARLVESGAAAGAARGSEWEVEIIAPGWSANGLYYSADVLRAAIPLFEGAKIYVFPDSPTGHRSRAEEKHIRFVGGWVDGVFQRPAGALAGRLHFLSEGEHASTVAKQTEAWGRGKRDLFGLSIDAAGRVSAGTHSTAGKSGRLVEAITAVSSVDVVINPAAGGRFTQLLESMGHPHTTTTESPEMTKVQRMLRILEARRPAVLAGINRETVTAGELAELMTDAELQEAWGGAPAPAPALTPETPPAGAPGQTDVAAELREARIERTQMRVVHMLRESQLLEHAHRVGGDAGRTALQRRLDRQFNGQILTAEQIQEALDSERDFLSALSPARPRGTGPSASGGTGVGPGLAERVELGLTRQLMESIGLRGALQGGAATATRIGLRDAYRELTCGADPRVSGRLTESVGIEYRDGDWGTREMLQEAITGSTFPRVMANVMHQVLLAAYAEVDYGEQHLITSRERAEDFRDYESINVGGFSDLADFSDPNGNANYQEIGEPDEESEKYRVGTKGNLLTVTRETIINDKAGVIARQTQMLGQAARRTHARFAFNRVLSNPVMSDGVTLFHASRGNLRTVAYSVAELEAIDQVLYAMTNAGGHDVLGMSIHQVFIPRALRSTAWKINSSDKVPGSANNDANDWHEHFGANHERIHVTPFMTDANDFLTTAAPTAVGGLVEMRYLFGQEEPELFTADSPTVGQMFVGDRLQYKIRHEYGGSVVAGGWRAIVRSIVA